MFKIAIILLISGVLLPYFGMWFTGTYMLGNGSEPNFVPMQIASMFAFLLSIGLLCLTKIERNLFVKAICIIIALAYPISWVIYLLSTQSNEYVMFPATTFFFKNCIAGCVAVLIFRNCREVHNEI